jgi:peptide/nickel transport system substrate-binding protein
MLNNYNIENQLNTIKEEVVMKVFIIAFILLILSIGNIQASKNEVLTVGMNELVSSLDPPTDWAIASTWVHMNLFDCLVWRNRKTADFEPWLATELNNISPTKWNIKLRKDVVFHNGEEFNADAVKWTYERITTSSRDKFITFKQWTFIKEIQKISDHEINIITQNPEPAFMSKMAGTGCGIQAPIAGKKNQSAGKYTPVGTGPYKLDEFKKDDFISMNVNENYWQRTPDVEKIIWRAIPESSTRIANLLTEDVDVTIGVPPQDWDRINSTEYASVVEYLTTRVMLLVLRTGPSKKNPDWTGVTSNKKIREAIKYAIDRKLILEVIQNMGVPSISRITPPTLGWDKQFYNIFGEYNPEKAKNLIKEAGYDGTPLVMHSSSSYLMQKEVAEIVASMLNAVGLKIDLRVMDVTTFREQVYYPYKNQDIYMDALGNSFFDPWIAVLSFRSDRRERTGWSGSSADKVDKLIRSAAVNMNPKNRANEYIELQKIVVEDGPMVPLYQMKDALGKNKRVKWDMPLDGFLWFGDAVIY